MAKKLMIRDISLRDDCCASFASRLSQDQLKNILPLYRDAGFYMVDMWGGAIPENDLRYHGDDPWMRVELFKNYLNGYTHLSSLVRGRNLLGYTPFPDSVIKDFCQEMIESGVDRVRIYDPLNDTTNIKTALRYVHKFGGLADCAICYADNMTFSPERKVKAALEGKRLPDAVFSDGYYLSLAMTMEKMGADMITLGDFSGIMRPERAAALVSLLKKNLIVPLNFHSHSRGGLALASTMMAILADTDVVDTTVWQLARCNAGVPIELVYLFCRKIGVEMDVDMRVVGAINERLKMLLGDNAVKHFNPATDSLPTEVDIYFNEAIKAARNNQEDELIKYCRLIEKSFGLEPDNEINLIAGIPLAVYNHMETAMTKSGKIDLLPEALTCLYEVRLRAGLAPMVPPIDKIIANQAILCAVNLNEGKEMFYKPAFQYKSLIKGEYGKTPIEVNPDFRCELTGSKEEEPFLQYEYASQNIPVNPSTGLPIAEGRRELLLLELFPTIAERFLTNRKSPR